MQIIVIGSGIIGSAISWEMARAGHDVISIDDNNPQGSAGERRIFRTAHENPLLEEDARRSLLLWRRWEDIFGEELILPNTLWVRGGWTLGEKMMGRYPLCASERGYSVDQDGGAGLIRKTISLLQADTKAERITAKVSRAQTGEVLLENGEILQGDFVFLAAGVNSRKIMNIPSATPWHHIRLSFPYKEEVEKPPPCLIDKTLGLYALPESDLFALGLPGEDKQIPSRSEEFARKTRRKIEKTVSDHFPYLIPRAEEMIYCTHEKRLPDGYEIERREKTMGITGINLFKFAPLLGDIALQEIEPR